MDGAHSSDPASPRVGCVPASPAVPDGAGRLLAPRPHGPQAAPPGRRGRARGQMAVAGPSVTAGRLPAPDTRSRPRDCHCPACVTAGHPRALPGKMRSRQVVMVTQPSPQGPDIRVSQGRALRLMHMHVLRGGRATSEHLTRFTNSEGSGGRGGKGDTEDERDNDRRAHCGMNARRPHRPAGGTGRVNAACPGPPAINHPSVRHAGCPHLPSPVLSEAGFYFPPQQPGETWRGHPPQSRIQLLGETTQPGA